MLNPRLTLAWGPGGWVPQGSLAGNFRAHFVATSTIPPDCLQVPREGAGGGGTPFGFTLWVAPGGLGTFGPIWIYPLGGPGRPGNLWPPPAARALLADPRSVHGLLDGTRNRPENRPKNP